MFSSNYLWLGRGEWGELITKSTKKRVLNVIRWGKRLPRRPENTKNTKKRERRRDKMENICHPEESP